MTGRHTERDWRVSDSPVVTRPSTTANQVPHGNRLRSVRSCLGCKALGRRRPPPWLTGKAIRRRGVYARGTYGWEWPW